MQGTMSSKFTEENQGIYRQFSQFTQRDKNFVRQEC